MQTTHTRSDPTPRRAAQLGTQLGKPLRLAAAAASSQPSTVLRPQSSVLSGYSGRDSETRPGDSIVALSGARATVVGASSGSERLRLKGAASSGERSPREITSSQEEEGETSEEDRGREAMQQAEGGGSERKGGGGAQSCLQSCMLLADERSTTSRDRPD
eukprot:750119-Hanusia_phi.AAC.2